MQPAIREADSPVAYFRIRDLDSGQEFIAQTTELRYLWGGREELDTARLHYQMEQDNQILSIRRSVGPQTQAAFSNNGLADAVLNLIYVTDSEEQADIFNGLTGEDIREFESDEQIQRLVELHYHDDMNYSVLRNPIRFGI